MPLALPAGVLAACSGAAADLKEGQQALQTLHASAVVLHIGRDHNELLLLWLAATSHCYAN